MKALLRPFALHAAYTPIETIVFFCIVGTLSYFHILSAIKHSAFLSPSYSHPNLALRPSYVLHRAGEWVGVRESRWIKERERPADNLAAAEVQQLVFNTDSWPVRAFISTLVTRIDIVDRLRLQPPLYQSLAPT